MSIWLHRFATFVAASTVVLIAAGGMVTSTDSGLSVPDWPNTYGWFMFSFPLEKMVGGIFYEHGHRMIASTVGFLTIVLAIWTWRVERRPWVRRLAVIALAAVIVQGLLGGITVLFLLPPAVSIGHAGLAQLFLCLTVSIALFTSPGWRAGRGIPVDDRRLQRLATTTTILVYAQIVAGATMRHLDAGMAIPDFPLVFGGILPPVWSAGIAIHYLHRLGAVLVTAFILATTYRVWTSGDAAGLRRPAALLVILVVSQVTLGALVVLSGLQPVINTAHVVNGALVLAASLVLALRSRQRTIEAALWRATSRGLPRIHADASGRGFTRIHADTRKAGS